MTSTIDNASKPTIPESHEQDTSLHNSNSSDYQTQLQDDLVTIPKEEEEEKQKKKKKKKKKKNR